MHRDQRLPGICGVVEQLGIALATPDHRICKVFAKAMAYNANAIFSLLDLR
jgi:hypothetical protein